MKGISTSNDTAGGGSLIPSQNFCTIDNKFIIIDGDSVDPHPPCGTPGGSAHCSATIVTASNVVFVNNKGVCRKEDIATCGDSATGSNFCFAD
jgi:uncharacterized Zn-binding protein involved in type VI secretion